MGLDADVTIYGQQAFDYLGWAIACGDVNGDRFADIAVDAVIGDSVNDSRADAGQVHLILGGPALPPTIDLLSYPATTIWGAVAGDRLGSPIEAGDLNSDGTADLVLGSRNAAGRSGTGVNFGRVYVLFGRANWPSSIDLLTTTETVLYGKSVNDFFSSDLHLGDLDRDGLPELIVGAVGGDGPGDQRTGCGEAHVFRGRTSWPAFIDLATSNADSMLFGADAGDQITNASNLGLGDFDLDGTVELVAGSDVAGGRPNNLPSVGEVRTRRMGPGYPASVDLRTQYTNLIYGADASDSYCPRVISADINGDRIDDIACFSTHGDGPDETRLDAGEFAAFYGRPAFPIDADFKPGQADLIVYGAQAEDELSARLVSDLNGDRDPEIVAAIRTNHATLKPRVVVLSTIDRDADGVLQLADNCPLVWNPSQSDTDADLIGDVCDGDYDGDGLGDASDCAPNLAAGGRPGDVQNVRFDPGSNSRITWNPTQFAEQYDLSRGGLDLLDPTRFGQCQNASDPDLTDTSFTDNSVPAASRGFYYLVRGRDLDCPATGTWGLRSDGVERTNADPEACP
jgi:hypothetical protein